MQRNGVIHSARNPLFREAALDLVAPWNADGVLMKNVLAPISDLWQHDTWDLFERAAVFVSPVAPRPVPLVQVAQLHSQHGRLNFVEAAVPPLLCTDVFAALPVNAQG